jgi:ABC-type transporter Mla MlaB component
MAVNEVHIRRDGGPAGLPEPPVPHAFSRARPLLDRRGDVLVIRGPIEPADIPAVCVDAYRLLDEAGRSPVVCEAAALGADLASVDALARIALTAQRLGVVVRFEAPPAALRDLLDLTGLGDVLWRDPGPGSGLRPRSAAAARRAGRTAPYRGRT